jgi:hypothetical protein
LDLPRGFILAASQGLGLLLENGRAESAEAVLNKRQDYVVLLERLK